MNVKVLALDLERTLIDDAHSGRARPGLREFLAYCLDRFERVTLFTSVETADAWEVLEELESNGFVPSDFLDRLEVVE